MEAAIYLRQSVDRYGDELAISRQREDCVDICETRGWNDREYVDNDRSATTGRRPAYLKMLDDIRAGRIGAVVVWDLDRLHRRPIELEHFIDLADEKHVALASVGGDADLSTDNGRLFARIKGAVARAEVERKSVRQKRAARQRAEAGIWWGPRPFGYSDGGTLVDIEAAAVREAYSAILANASLYSIAARWNNAGMKTTQMQPIGVELRVIGWTAAVERIEIERRRTALDEFVHSHVRSERGPSLVIVRSWSAN